MVDDGEGPSYNFFSPLSERELSTLKPEGDDIERMTTALWEAEENLIIKADTQE